MRLTVEIDEDSLREIQAATGEAKKSPAVQKALALFLRERRKRELMDMVRRGEVDYPLTNDEIEAMWEDDVD